MVGRTKALEAYQEAEDDPETVKCIPMLKREDIRKEADHFFNEELDVEGSLFLYHDVCTNGIGYVDLLFDLEASGTGKGSLSGTAKGSARLCGYRA